MNAKDARAALTSRRSFLDESFAGFSLLSVRVGRAWITRCSFDGADLRHATFDGSSMKLCGFRGADLRGSSLRYVRFAGCDLRDADLRDADLTGARFGYVNTGSDHGRTDLTGARLEGAALADAVFERVIGH